MRGSDHSSVFLAVCQQQEAMASGPQEFRLMEGVRSFRHESRLLPVTARPGEREGVSSNDRKRRGSVD